MENEPNSIDSSSSDISINDRRREFENVDYLSFMPIEVLIHIFSFLPMKLWILMCLVSKRWRYFWKEMPILEFNQTEMQNTILKENMWCSSCDDSHSYYGTDHDCHRELRSEASKEFMSIVNRILLFHSGCPIKNFKLSIDYDKRGGYGGYINNIHTWVDFAFKSNISSVELNFWGRRERPKWDCSMYTFNPYRFRESYFAPKNLQELTLSGCFFEAYVFKALVSLKYLSLMDISIFDCSIEYIHNVCPLLETLLFHGCHFQPSFMICEEELRIKYLSIVNCESLMTRTFPISIIAPRLLFLTIIAKQLTNTNVRRPINLISATIFDIGKNQDPDLGSYVDSLLRDMSQCNYLELNTRCIQALPIRNDLQPPLNFQRVIGMTLRMFMGQLELPGLAYLVRCCPKLESLVMNIDMPPYEVFRVIEIALGDIEEIHWEAFGFDQLHCMQHSLKKVYLNGFSGKKIEIKVVKLLLRNALVLEELNITAFRLGSSASTGFKLIYEELVDTYAQIADFVKASPHAIINTSF